MIPLHLRTTTIHVTEQQAERLVAVAAAEWLPGIRALLLTPRASEREALAVLA